MFTILPSSERPERVRILVVDDNAANIVQVRGILGPEVDVFAATDGRQALTIIDKLAPDLIVMDVQMPGMDGLETCRHLRADDKMRDIPVIFMTAGGNATDEDACWMAGGSDFVSKPINATTLRHRVRAQLMIKAQSDRLRGLAYVDALTGLPNRQRFNNQFDAEFRRSLRNGIPLSLLIMDVDYFKLYNDHYGHVAGDLCLNGIGACLKSAATRPGDLVARFGGEEFVGLLPETQLNGALHVANVILDNVRDAKIEHVASPIGSHVSASIGVTCWIPGRSSITEVDQESLLREADRLLYRAKAAGRAQICGDEFP